MTTNKNHNSPNVPNSTDKGNKIRNVPALRFPEFTEEWENHVLQDTVTFSNGKAHENCVNEDGDYILVNSKFVSTNGQIQKRVTSQLSPLCKSQFVMVMSDLPNGKALAKCYYIEEDNKFTLNQRICSFSAKNGNISKFLMYQINRNKYYMRFDDGINQTNLKKNEVLSCPVFIPSIKEQEKIATLLHLIDERIATQNKIIEDLKKLKSAISKHLFSRKDLLETTIRLADIAALKNGYAFQSSKYDTKGKWKILTIANVSGERYINDDDCNCIINLPNDIQGHQILKEGDILISLTGNVGRVSLCMAGNILLNQRVGLLCITKNVNQEFLYQVLSSRRFENSMVACGQGAAQMNIGKGDVENFVLPYSSNANNIHLVARILHSYDECIINEQQELTLLTMQKQYLLDQMFI